MDRTSLIAIVPQPIINEFLMFHNIQPSRNSGFYANNPIHNINGNLIGYVTNRDIQQILDHQNDDGIRKFVIDQPLI